MEAPGIVDTLEELRRAGFDIPRINSGDENVRVSCPLAPWSMEHRTAVDRNPGMSIRVNPGGSSAVMCWTCQWRGTLTKLLWELYRLHPKADIAILVGDVAEKEEQAWYDTRFDKDTGELLPKVPVRHAPKVHDEEVMEPYLKVFHMYALRRGLTMETCKAWGLGYDKEGGRLVIPVRDSNGMLMGALGRTLRPGGYPKYLANYFGRGLRRDLFLFGEQMRDGDCRDLYLAEGSIDAMLLWQQGYRSPLAIMGTGLSQTHVDKVVLWAERVFFLFDNDGAGRKALESASEMLRGQVKMYAVTLPEHRKDVGEATPDEVREAIEEAVLVL